MTSIPFHETLAPHEAVSDLPPQLALGSLVAVAPVRSTSNVAAWSRASDELLAFLPGSTQCCESYSQFLETIGKRMYTVCIPYDNVVSVGTMCEGKARCYPDLRMEAFNGSFHGVWGNNIQARLAGALTYLYHRDDGLWSRYLNYSTGLPIWSRIRMAGHSQGAGAAAMIGYNRELARVVQFSGVCDRSNWTASLGPPATPASRFFGLASAWDTLLCPTFMRQISSWKAEGALPNNSWPLSLHVTANFTTTSLGDSHTVVSDIDIPGCDMAHFNQTCDMMAHDSTVMSWPDMMSPYADGLWQALCGI